MSFSRPVLILIAICASLIVLSLLGLVFDFTTLMEFHPDIDGLLMLFVCLMMGGLFSLMLFRIAKGQGWLPGKKHVSEEGK
jgi:predicted Na+-dependent transporter